MPQDDSRVDTRSANVTSRALRNVRLAAALPRPRAVAAASSPEVAHRGGLQPLAAAVPFVAATPHWRELASLVSLRAPTARGRRSERARRFMARVPTGKARPLTHRPKRPKRLLMVVHGPYPVGEPRVARETAAALGQGFEVDVLALRRPGERAKEVVEGAVVRRIRLTHRRGRGPLGMVAEYVGFALVATAAVASLMPRRRWDVVQVHNPPDFLVATSLVPKLFGSRVLFDIHDLSSDMFAMRFRRGGTLAEPALRLIERGAIKAADRVLTVHEPYRRELVARGTPATKVTVVMNGLDERLVTTEAPIPRDNGFRVFYHGTVAPHYGVHLLVEAAARLRASIPDIQVEICGEGDALPEVRERARALGVDDRVTVSGSYLEHREVLERARSASVGVVPNLPIRLNRFALSSKLFEYVALGVPVVSADLPTLKEHFSDDELVFFQAGDVDSLAQALLQVAHDPLAAKRRARAAAVRYESYRWQVSAERYIGILEALAARSPV